MRKYLPDSPCDPFRLGNGDCVESSYRDHGYGAFLHALARTMRPSVCVELGVYQGFSLLSVAAALRDNGHGHITGVDLFERYPYRHELWQDARARVERSGLAQWAQVRRGDALEGQEDFAEVDWLHVDLSNDGELVQRCFERWEPRVAQLMLFEGGAPERDRVAWMTAYAKTPISPVVEALRSSHRAWRFVVLAPYPSMTVAIRESECAVP